MGAWGFGMMENDHALDYVDKFRIFDDAKEAFILNKRGQDVMKGKLSLLEVFKQIQKRDEWSPDVPILGIAEFFLKCGFDLKPCKPLIRKSIQNELRKKVLEDWCEPSKRVEALKRFKDLIGKK